MTATADDLELHLRRQSGDTCTVDVRFRPGDSAVESHPVVDAPVRLDATRLLALALNAPAYGAALTRMLFADARLVETFREARAHAQGARVPLRVRLRLDRRDQALHALRWETLQDPTALAPAFLATDSRTLLSRYLDVSDIQTIDLRPRGVLRALVVVANPGDLVQYNLPPVDATGEVERARTALGAIDCTVLASHAGYPRPTWANLVAALQREIDILYLVCHGTLHDGMPFLWLEDAMGQVERVPATSVTARVRELHHRPLLVVLAACGTAGHSHGSDDARLALGPQLAQTGIGAVVAMYDSITAAAVAQSMPVFFHQLQTHGVVDQAMAAARSLLADQGNDWWKLVLFLRLSDGRLWPALRRSRVFQAPPLPMHFVPRPEVGDRVRAQLLAVGTGRPGVLVISAVQGLAGVGKTTLATALAHDAAVQAHFPDGVLWAHVGPEPDVPGIRGAWLAAMRSAGWLDQSAGQPDGPAAGETGSVLRSLLQNRRALIVLDDVWRMEDVRPLLAGGSGCAVLITTRRADVADERGSVPHVLDVMTPDQALELLALGVGYELSGAEQTEAAHLARAVGYLPLALELAAARVRKGRGTTWAGLTHALSGEVSRLEALDEPRRPVGGSTRLEATFALSLEALRAEDPPAWQAFVRLGLLPAATIIAAPLVTTLWEVDQNEARRILEVLWLDALLRGDEFMRIGAVDYPAYRLHDLMHAVARRMVTRTLGTDLPTAHAALLERYRARTVQRRWHTLPDDGYIHAYLRWHMEQAGRHAEIHALLGETTDDGRNGWFAARERLGQIEGYLVDVERAWTLADALPATDAAAALALQCRYLLLTTSLGSLAGSIPVSLLAALVRNGIWTPSQARAYAQRIPHALQRVQALAALAALVDEPVRLELLNTALATTLHLDDDARVQALAHLVFLLPFWLLHEAYDALRALPDAGARARALVCLLPRLAELGETQTALDATHTIHNDRLRAQTLVALAPHLPDDLRQQVLQAVRELRSSRARAVALARLDRYVADPLLPEALATLPAIGDGWNRVRTLEALAPHLPLPLLQAALNEVPRLPRAELRETALAALLPRLAEEGLSHKALERIDLIRDQQVRATALIRAAPHLPEALLARVLASVPALHHPHAQTRVLVGIARHLPERLLRQALQIARSLRSRDTRDRTLAGLVPRLAEIGAPHEALQIALALRDERLRASALAGLAPHLPPSQLPAVVQAVQQIRYVDARAGAMAGLAPYLPENLLPQAVRLLWSIGDVWERVATQVCLAPYLPEASLRRVWQGVLALPQGETRAQALALLAPHLPVELLRQALALPPAPSAQREWMWVDELAAVAPHLPAELHAQAHTTAKRLVNPHARVRALVHLAAHLRDTVIPEALAIARTLERGRARAFVKLAPFLSEPELREALEAVRLMGDLRARAQVLGELAPHLPAALVQQAFAMTRGFGDVRARAQVLGELAPYLPEAAVREALRFVRGMRPGTARTRALTRLAPRLMALGHTQAALQVAWSIRQPESQAALLAVLIPQLAQMGSTWEAYETLQFIRDPHIRALALAHAAPHFPERLVRHILATEATTGAEQRQVVVRLLARLAALGCVQEALDAAWTLGDAETQARTLIELVPYVSGAALVELPARVQQIPHSAARTDLCVALLRRLVEPERPDESVRMLWTETLHALAGHSRRAALTHLQTLVPVFIALGGTAESLCDTIEESGRWFA